jgi:hypothetical protein
VDDDTALSVGFGRTRKTGTVRHAMKYVCRVNKARETNADVGEGGQSSRTVGRFSVGVERSVTIWWRLETAQKTIEADCLMDIGSRL